MTYRYNLFACTYRHINRHIHIHSTMDSDEKKLRQEDCHEDSLGAGILTLTSKRVAFDKTRARIMDFTKHMGDTVMEASLRDIIRVWKEGVFMRKMCITVRDGGAEKTYKFGVLSAGGWTDAVQDAIDDM